MPHRANLWNSPSRWHMVEVDGTNLHSQDFVWAFLVYQVLEIGPRSISLALLALVLRAYFFPVLVWLWVSRAAILRRSLGPGRESLGFRPQARLVGMPFMDSVMDDVCSYDLGCAFTTVEFLICALVSVFASTGGEVQVSANIRLVWCSAAAACTVGKLLLGFLIVRPFKKVVGFGYSDEKEQEPMAAGNGSGDVERGDRPRVDGAASDESDPGQVLEMTGIRRGKAESRVAPLEGTHLQPATRDLSTSAADSTSGEAKVEN